MFRSGKKETSMNKSPFTATQWEELEHQALIFKYMVSGIQVPPDLLFTLKRSYLDTISHHPPQHIGSWNCFQMGLGRKIDPEPGRCRRTDGKKWRCSKEAFPESKYCERHMHRGKNRSRKPVEVSKPPSCGVSTLTKNNNNNMSLVSSDHHHTQNRHSFHYYPPNCYNNNDNVNNAHLVDQNPSFVYHASSTPRPNNNNNNNTTSLLFDSDVRNRYVYGMKEEVDEHAFFSEEPSSSSSRTLRDQFSSASSMDDSWRLTPLTISSSSSSSSKLTRNELSYYSHNAKLDHHDRTQQRCDRREDQTRKTIHFFDERPMKEKDSWLDLDDKSSNTTAGSVFSTQLSISMPTSSSYDFPIFSSRTRNGD